MIARTMIELAFMPALSMARKQGQQSVCQSNLRQIGLAAAMYSDDNNHRIPRGTGSDAYVIWFQVFLPYLHKCISDRGIPVGMVLHAVTGDVGHLAVIVNRFGVCIHYLQQDIPFDDRFCHHAFAA